TPFASLSSPSIPNPVASPKDSTLYRVVVSNEFSCTDTAWVQVNVSKKPVADAGEDQYILRGQTAQLSGTAGGTAVTYGWLPVQFMDNPASLQPVVSPAEDISYTLEVVSNNGCGTASDVVKVHVFEGLYVPNAFSPNGDGLNDVWNIPALRAYPEYEIQVFNRWGQVVYTSKDIGKPWNGRLKDKDLPSGVYAYIIRVKGLPATLKGWVMLVR
ncbi:MAG TPA: gliding motility-associated C-terminal domain-containing protein, partial [Flavisolibacter sp.]|nr:gliding motility-associated C-terminal domain-containing protein [Flavisolibacter sp.]